MKKLLFLFVLLQFSLCFAQRPNGGRRGNNNTGQATKQPSTLKFESVKVAGILKYDAKKVLKKLKLKKSDSISEVVTSHINIYNTEIEKIKATHKDLFEALDIVVNQNMEAAMKTRNREGIQETRKMIDEKLNPIREDVITHQNQLNSSFETILKEEQNTKWLEYQKSRIAKLRPKRRGNDARNRPDNTSGRSRRSRG